MQCYEPILFGCKPPRARYLTKPASNMFMFIPVHSKKKIHIFQKPILLLQKFILESSNPGQLVLDTFAGSASTLIAAKSLSRKAIGYELNPDHYRAACELLELDNDNS